MIAASKKATHAKYGKIIKSELSKNELDPIWISVIDLDYAYGQLKLSPKTRKH